MVLIKIGVWIYHYNTSSISFIIRSWYLLVKSYQGEYIPVTRRIFLGSNVDLFVNYTCQLNQTIPVQYEWAGNGIL